MPNRTKYALEASLKKLLLKKPLDKITINDLTSDCGISRMAFYYHFKDIYDLLKWILEEEAVEVVKQFDLLVDYKEAILFVIDYIEKNSHILACAYNTLGREEMRRFLYQDFISIISSLIDGVEKELNIFAEKDFKQFLSNLYAESLAGILIEWFKNPGNQNKEQIVEYLSIIFRSSLPEILKNLPDDKRINPI